MNKPWSFLLDRHIPIAIRWVAHKPNRQVIGLLPALAWLTGSKRNRLRPIYFLDRSVAIARRIKLTWVCAYHRLVLGLGNLVFA
jgi:hypothetical protein